MSDVEMRPAAVFAEVGAVCRLDPAEHTIAPRTARPPCVSDEAGVVTNPAGRRHDAAAFLRARSCAGRLPAVAALIGRAACPTIDHLRTPEE